MSNQKECPGKCRECGYDKCHDAKTAEIESWKKWFDLWCANGSPSTTKEYIDKLQSQVERYRGALERIWNHAGTALQSVVPTDAKKSLVQEIKDFAREALTDPTHD